MGAPAWVADMLGLWAAQDRSGAELALPPISRPWAQLLGEPAGPLTEHQLGRLHCVPGLLRCDPRLVPVLVVAVQLVREKVGLGGQFLRRDFIAHAPIGMV